MRRKNFFLEPVAAIATPSGSGALGIIRLSGNNVLDSIEQFFSVSKKKILLKPRFMHYGILKDRQNNHLDSILLVWFPGPASYTGEDVVEIHTHGGSYILQRIMNLLASCGIRAAARGEFSRRSFLNGKNDLTRLEAVRGLCETSDRDSHERAIAQLEGGLVSYLKDIRDGLLQYSAELEASLDHPDEELVSEQNLNKEKFLKNSLKRFQNSMEDLQEQKMFRSGLKVTITGRANAGKSSLMNALLGYERVLVASQKGTTRDVVSETVQLSGNTVILSDTAGLKDPDNCLDRRSMAHTLSFIRGSHKIIFCVDQARKITGFDRELWQEVKKTEKEVLVLLTKADIKEKIKEQDLIDLTAEKKILSVSVRTGKNISKIKTWIKRKAVVPKQDRIYYSARYLFLFKELSGVFQKIIQSLQERHPQDMIAVEIRSALKIISEFTGEDYTEKILDRVFNDFCIGK